MKKYSAALAVFVMVLLVPASQGTTLFQANLTGAQEVPSTNSPATGFVSALLRLEVDRLEIGLTFSNLSSGVGAVANIYCCVPSGVNGSVVLPLVGFPTAVTFGSGFYQHAFTPSKDLVGITPVAFEAAL